VPAERAELTHGRRPFPTRRFAPNQPAPDALLPIAGLPAALGPGEPARISRCPSPPHARSRTHQSIAELTCAYRQHIRKQQRPQSLRSALPEFTCHATPSTPVGRNARCAAAARLARSAATQFTHPQQQKRQASSPSTATAASSTGHRAVFRAPRLRYAAIECFGTPHAVNQARRPQRPPHTPSTLILTAGTLKRMDLRFPGVCLAPCPLAKVTTRECAAATRPSVGQHVVAAASTCSAYASIPRPPLRLLRCMLLRLAVAHVGHKQVAELGSTSAGALRPSAGQRGSRTLASSSPPHACCCASP
jgi:hypothetical protein